MSDPQAGNHADLYEIKDRVDEIAEQLEDAGISRSLSFDMDTRDYVKGWQLFIEQRLSAVRKK